MAVIKWRLSAKYAIDKVVRFLRESFDLLHARHPQITRAIADAQIISGVAAGPLDTFVVNLDLLIGFKIIPDEHLLFAADERSPHLYWRQPVHVEMGDNLIREIHGDERHIFSAIHV